MRTWNRDDRWEDGAWHGIVGDAGDEYDRKGTRGCLDDPNGMELSFDRSIGPEKLSWHGALGFYSL